MEVHDKHRVPCLFVNLTIKRDEIPVPPNSEAPKHDREFVAFCHAVDGRGWGAHVFEVNYEERGTAESGPMGLSESWDLFAEALPLPGVPVWHRASGISLEQSRDPGRFYAPTADLVGKTEDISGAITQDVDPDVAILAALERAMHTALFEEAYFAGYDGGEEPKRDEEEFTPFGRDAPVTSLTKDDVKLLEKEELNPLIETFETSDDDPDAGPIPGLDLGE